MPVSLTRTVEFTATHRYFRPDWTAEQNEQAFGPLGAEPGHSHVYRCSITVAGPIDSRSATIMDLTELDRIIDEEITSPLHQRHLNLDVAEFAYGKTLPTCEAVAQLLYRRIAARLPEPVTLERIRVAEDASLHADYTGPA
ncbi:MAG: 6-carboxytetrahydropterin synthase [Gemmatimonadales bacterium]|nr:6-carboxytetrahydropterin synthase [Gemmatimonadales bacterium]